MMRANRRPWNVARYDPLRKTAQFESYFLRANHPSRPLAFWLRYTLYAPPSAPAEGELWAIWFDGERKQVKNEYLALPMSECSFSRSELAVRVGSATLDAGSLDGRTQSIAWHLQYATAEPVFLLYGEAFYKLPAPKTKIATPAPNALFTGTLDVGGEVHAIDRWRGAQSHVWSSAHAEFYAYGQVCGFDNEPDAFFESASGRVRVLPFWAPMLSGGVLRLKGRDYCWNSVRAQLQTRGEFANHSWTFSAASGDGRLRGTIVGEAPLSARLDYRDPSGPNKVCVNTKLARCELVLSRPGQSDVQLVSKNSALFEVLGAPEELARAGF